MANTRKTGPVQEFTKRHEWIALGMLCLCVFLVIGFISYNPGDLYWYSTEPNNPPINYGGMVGATINFALVFLYGFSVLLLPLFLLSLTWRLIRGISFQGVLIWFFYLQLALVSCSLLLELANPIMLEDKVRYYQIISPGGILGAVFGRDLVTAYLGRAGGLFLCSMFLFISLQGIYSFSITALCKSLCRLIWKVSKGFISGVRQGSLWLFPKLKYGLLFLLQHLKPAKKEPKTFTPYKKPAKGLARPAQVALPPTIEVSSGIRKGPKTPRREPKPLPKKTGDYHFPSLDLLIEPAEDTLDLEENLKANGQRLVQTLAEFDIESDIVGIESGPVITRYEIQIGSGIKVQKVTALDNDIALAMRAKSVRIIAPIPGKAAIGIEIPNQIRKMVTFKELVDSEEMDHAKSRVPLLLGKNISGRPVVADLTTMPHLLIAGATGAGKSVCINTLIISILYTLSPDEVKIMLVDPKKVEMATYKRLPHLFVPLITNPNKVARGLRSLIEEMDQRYSLFKEVGVRNLESYNNKDKASVRKHLSEMNPDVDTEEAIPDKLPYIIVIVDELADLMMVSKSEVESSIVRIAQLSRAVGIHLILATQRPSVDVVTGLIKANIPARIAFRVSAKVDSRTVLDTQGADKLLGNGDMLFLNPASTELERIQGAYLDDNEIHKVVEAWEQQGAPQYDQKCMDAINRPESEDEGEADPLFDDAIAAIQESGQASTSFLQRRLRIGYNRASRLVDELENRGILGPPTSGKNREIYLEPSET